MKRTLGIALAPLVVCLLACLPGQASAAKPGAIAYVDGTNGYEIVLQARGDRVSITASSRKSFATYKTSGVVKKRAVSANFGQFGSVDLRFYGNGKGPEDSFPDCRVRSGVWKGALSFRATNGFTATYATEMPGKRIVGSWFCQLLEDPLFEQNGFRARRPQSDVIFITNHGSKPAQKISALGIAGGERGLATVFASEQVGSVRVVRSIDANLKRRHLRFNSERKRAKLNPPAPFSGVGKFRGHRRPNQRWHGDLAVTLPGASEETPLTGPGFTAGLLRFDAPSLDKFFPRVRPLQGRIADRVLMSGP